MWGNRNTAPLDTTSQIKMCFGIFTRDNQSKQLGGCTSMHENQPANTNNKSSAGSFQQSSKQQNGDVRVTL